MTTASNTFFTFPELITLLAPHLPRRDFIHLATTNRTTHAICIPLVWKALDLLNYTLLIRLLNSPKGLQALGNIVHRVRTLTWKPFIAWCYLLAV